MAIFPGWAVKNPFAKADRAAQGMDVPAPRKVVERNSEEPDPSNPDPNKKGTGKGGQGDDPMAELASLWQPNKDKDGKDIPDTEPTSESYMPKLDNAKLQAMVEKMSFTDGITEEEIAAIEGGGKNAMGAFANMLNRAGRKSFHTAFSASSKLAEQGFTRAQKRFQDSIPNYVRDQMVDGGLGEATSLANNPMFAPLVKNVKAQYMKKYPKATPQEVSTGIKQYFDAMGAEYNKSQQKTKEVDDPEKKLRMGADDANFEDWLGDEIKGVGGVRFPTSEEGSEDTVE